MDAVLVAGDAIDLIRVGAASIAAVIKRGEVVSSVRRTGARMKLTELTRRRSACRVPIARSDAGRRSAAALAGAIGASLLAMVAGLPKSRAADRGGRRAAAGRAATLRGARRGR